MYKLFKRSYYPGHFEVQIAGAYDTGMSREHNEDAISIQEDDGRGYYMAIVCDGMGGHNAGELASALAVEKIRAYLDSNFRKQGPRELLYHGFLLASTTISEHTAKNPDTEGMGCTCVMVMGIRDKMWVAHSGDSRAYLIDKKAATAITLDHTMVQELVTKGVITKEQAAVHPYRGRISRCLGHGRSKGVPDINAGIIELGDNILLCSDGLSDVVSNEEMHSIVIQNPAQEAVRKLVQAANHHGGPDNISAVILRRVQ